MKTVPERSKLRLDLLAAACARMGVAEPRHGTIALGDTIMWGPLFWLPGWTNPILFDSERGAIVYDGFGVGKDKTKAIDRLFGFYEAEAAKEYAHRMGYAVQERANADGGITIEIDVVLFPDHHDTRPAAQSAKPSPRRKSREKRMKQPVINQRKPMTQLTQRLGEYIAAAFTGIWIQSYEHHDALVEIAQLCRDRKWSLASWDIERGLLVSGQTAPGASDPLAAIRSLPALAKTDSSALLVLPNFHRFLNSPEIVQALARQIQEGKTARTFIVILSPVVQIPPELEKVFVVLDHDLPDKSQLLSIAQGIATEARELPAGQDLDRLLDAASGLTRYEAEGAFSLSLVRHGSLTPEAVWELKGGMLKKSGLLQLHRGGERFADLGGLEAMKQFCLRALSSRHASAKPRGILLLGVPGTGKSAFAKALGNEIGRPTLVLDIGALMGGIVGSTEQNTRQALRIVDAMAPCVCFVDECEKALSGAASSGHTDSGVSARLFGSMLSWLSDHESDVFFIATSNDIAKLPPEFARSERFDGLWFLDLPAASEKQKIWEMYLRRFQLPKQALPKDSDWTGAEIRSCCRLAALLDVPLIEAAKNVVPVAVTAAESVERLRSWAGGRCLDASRGGIYTRGGDEGPKVRRVTRASAN